MPQPYQTLQEAKRSIIHRRRYELSTFASMREGSRQELAVRQAIEDELKRRVGYYEMSGLSAVLMLVRIAIIAIRIIRELRRRGQARSTRLGATE